MMFSIVVPVYNGERYLWECLESVAAQTFHDYELIVVDDGSTDGSGGIADHFASMHSNVIIHHSINGGPLIARRRGFASCHGDYVLLLDADDKLAPDALHCIADTIVSTNADIVSFGFSRATDFSTMDNHGSPVAGLYDGKRFNTIKQNVLNAGFNNLCGKVFRRCRIDVGADYSLYPRLLLAEDLLQLLPIVDASSSLARLDTPFYYYRPSETSSTSTYKHYYLSNSEIVANKLLEYGDCWGMPDAALDGVLILYVNVLRLLVRHGSREDIEAELPLVGSSLRNLTPNVDCGIRRQRPDLRVLLGAAMRDDARGVRLAVGATDYARRLLRRG